MTSVVKIDHANHLGQWCIPEEKCVKPRRTIEDRYADEDEQIVNQEDISTRPDMFSNMISGVHTGQSSYSYADMINHLLKVEWRRPERLQ